MTKTKRNIIIIVAAVVALIGIVLAIVLPLTLNTNKPNDETYTVTFESNGGTAVASITDVKHGSTITEPAAPTKSGHTFEGWFSDAALKTKWKFDTDTVTSNITLYAKWKYNETSGLLMLLNEETNTYTVGGIGNAKDVENLAIPETYKNLPVATIAQNAFSGVKSIKTVYVPSCITAVMSAAFRDCSNLVTVTIAGENTTLGANTFSGCAKLASVNLPSGLTTISNGLFNGCSSLEQVIIPEGVTSIGERAFYECVKLSQIELTQSIAEIGDLAFGTCASLTEINLPASVTTLGDKAFSGCKGLAKLTVSSGNRKYYAEGNCIIEIVSQGSFKLVVGCKASQIPSNVTVIGSGAFCGCRAEDFTSITIPSGVTEIQSDAFNGCENLARITIPYTVTKIGDYAFSSCYSLAEISFGTNDDDEYGIKELGQEAFAYCYDLAGIHLPPSLTRIGRGLLCGCDFAKMSAVTYGKDANNLPYIIDSIVDGVNDHYTTQVEVRGANGSNLVISGLA